MLVSRLWDKFKEVKTYYVYRDDKGSTRVTELDVSKLAKELVTSEDILLSSPTEVVEKYAVRKQQ